MKKTKLLLLVFLLPLLFGWTPRQWVDTEQANYELAGDVRVPVRLVSPHSIKLEVNNLPDGLEVGFEQVTDYDWFDAWTEDGDLWFSLNPQELGVFYVDVRVYNLDSEYFAQTEQYFTIPVKSRQFEPDYSGCRFGSIDVYEDGSVEKIK